MCMCVHITKFSNATAVGKKMRKVLNWCLFAFRMLSLAHRADDLIK